MSRYINALFSLLLLMGAVSCSDDFSWNGVEVGEDEYLIAFAPAPQTVVTIEGTRVPSEAVSELTLVIFKDDKLAVEPVTVLSSDNQRFTAPSGENGTGTIKINRSLLADGDRYLIANASAKISQVIASNPSNGTKISKADFLQGMSYDEGQFPTGTDANTVMVAHKDDVTLTTDAQTIADIFMLERLFAKISVEMGTGDIPFRLTEARLTRYADNGDMTLGGPKDGKLTTPTTGYTDKWVAFKNAPAADRNSFTSAKDGEVYYGKPGAQLMQYSFPYIPVETAAEGETSTTSNDMMMLVKGYYSKGDFETVEKPCFYAIPIPEVQANHHYKIKIVGASMQGYDSATEAVIHPNGIIVVFEDATEDIKNIITDGENVLAVQDTVRIKADQRSITFPIKVRHAGKNAPTITLTKKGEENASWLGGLTNYASWPYDKNNTDPNSSESKNNLFNATITGSVTTTVNAGSERAAVYTISLDGTTLERDIVFLQEAPTSIMYQDNSGPNTIVPIDSLTLTIKRGSSTIVKDLDYLSFINKEVVTSPASTQCQGIQPNENGSRVRNLGLHMPMPNGGVTYTYKIKTKNGYKIGGATTATYTYTDTDVPADGSDKYSYVVKTDAITITNGTNTYTLDLYHTGFFHKDGTTWYYYEVYKQGSADLYWLDRNLGATACGMDVRVSANGVLSGGWPLTGGASFGTPGNNTSVTCPAGWTLPTYGQLRSLTVSSGFAIQLRYDSSQEKYYAPSYQFTAIEDGQTKLIRNYFPADMVKKNGTVTGERGAGYYLTMTPAAGTNYYQTMQFAGMNVTSQNTNMSNTFMSVRCCAGIYNPETDGTKYTCKVKGYTHVYMYYQSSDGTKTSLNTWPGDQIAVASDTTRFHPFEITPTMNYDLTRLYVVFNTVDAGVIKGSNVSATDRTNRIGIKFKNKGSYTSAAPYDDERPGQKGHWVAEEQADYSNEIFRLKGNFNNLNWGNPSNSYEFTSKGLVNNKVVYELTVDVTVEGEFVIAQKNTGWNSGQYNEWKHNVKNINGTAITPGTTYTLYSNGDDYNWKFAERGKYTITLNWTGEGGSFVATKEGGGNTGDDEYTYAIHGSIFDSNWATKDMQPKNGKWVLENVTTPLKGAFGIKKMKGSEQIDWIAHDGNGTVTLNTAMSAKVNGTNWKDLEAGTYTFTFDPTANTLTVTGTASTPTGPTNGETLDKFKPGKYYLSFNGDYKLWMWIDGDSDKISDAKGESWNNKVQYSNGVEFELYNTAESGKVLKVNYFYTNETKNVEKSYPASNFKWNSSTNRWEYNAGNITGF